jgi:high affinity Mn2+ porin
MYRFIITLSLLAAGHNAYSQSDTLRKPASRFNLHFQTTYIYQYSARFHSPYEGAHSLSADEERQNSLTMTLYGGARLWKGAEVYVNPEIAGGSGLSGALGMGGSSNGETFRVGDPSPTLYLGRAFFIQTIGIRGSDVDTIGDGANALAAYTPKNHLRLIIGKYSLGDLFDQNNVSNSPRTQFINWSLMNTGAWDYAANVRGYTLAAAAELSLNNWRYKMAAAALPIEANGDRMETQYDKSLALNASVEHTYRWHGREGNMRLLGFHNRTHMGNYAQATHGSTPQDTPDITATRDYGRTKTGFAFNADQELNDNLSAFTRIGWNDGKNETWCFTEIDRTFALGAQLKGNKWKRGDDVLGLAFVVNGLSKEHRDYLTAGGNGFILGDGGLNYAPEAIGEIYYSAMLRKEGLWISADYQLCVNPGYNKDRGPASIASIRVHVEL